MKDYCEYPTENKLFGLSGNGLKIITLVAMFFDHLAWVIIDPRVYAVFGKSFPSIIPIDEIGKSCALCLSSYLFHFIGRISMPVFLFMISEGIEHTRSTVKYGLRLLVLALISEIPFDVAVYRTTWYSNYQNVFFTLFLALIAMYAIKQINNQPVLAVIVPLICCVAAWFLKSDYSFRGVLMGCIIQIFRKRKTLACALACSVLIISNPIYFTSLLSVPLVYLYNGERGPKLKYFFYFFYPTHFVLLHILDYFLIYIRR